MSSISLEDLNYIKECEQKFAQVLSTMEYAQSFHLGDYLMLTRSYNQPKGSYVQKNSYGVAYKYKVVHVDRNSISYVQHLNANGIPSGRLACVIYNEPLRLDSNFAKYILDPDYVDHMLLSPDTAYDPMSTHNAAQAARKSVLKYNASIRLDLTTLPKVIEVVKDFSVGQEFWVSSKRGFSIKSLNYVNRPVGLNAFYKDGTKIRYRVVNKYVIELTITWSNGKVEKMLPHNLVNKNLYIQTPLTYKKISDTI